MLVRIAAVVLRRTSTPVKSSSGRNRRGVQHLRILRLCIMQLINMKHGYSDRYLHKPSVGSFNRTLVWKGLLWLVQINFIYQV